MGRIKDGRFGRSKEDAGSARRAMKPLTTFVGQRRYDLHVRVTLGAALALCALSGLVPSIAHAETPAIYFSYFGHPEPTTGQLANGFYNVSFRGLNGIGGSITRAGVVVATAQSVGSKYAGLETNLLPGDVAHLTSSEGPELTWTFTGYPTVVSDQCGSTVVSGQAAPGEPVWGAAFDQGVGTLGHLAKPVNSPGSYTATFAQPLLPAALVRVESHVASPQLEVRIDFVVRTQEPCVSTPPPPTEKPAMPSSTTKCHVPNLKHASLKRAKYLLRKAHCRLGKVTARRGSHHRKHVVVRQNPVAKAVRSAGTRVNLRLT